VEGSIIEENIVDGANESAMLVPVAGYEMKLPLPPMSR